MTEDRPQRDWLGQGIRLLVTAGVAVLLLTSTAFAQGAVQQLGPVVPGHLPMWGGNGKLMDAGGSPGLGRAPANSANPGSRPTGLGLVNPGLGQSQWSGYASGPYSEFSTGFDGNGNVLLKVGRVGGGPRPECNFDINGSLFPCAGILRGVTVLTADNTGATNVTASVQSAINTACTTQASLFVPSGTYKFLSNVNVGCLMTLWAVPGTVVFIADAANPDLGTDTPQILKITASNVTVDGIIFDGNVAGGNVNIRGLVRLKWPTTGFTFRRSQIRNAYGSSMFFVGEDPINVTASASLAGQPDITFASLPATVRVGAHVNGAQIDPGSYVISTTPTTATLNTNLTDRVSGTVQFTRGFTVTADALYGATTLAVADTSGLSVGETIYDNDNPQCIQSDTRITSIVANVSVAVDKIVICKVSSGSLFAAAGGNSDVTVELSTFNEIGQPQLHGLAADYATVGIQSSGASTLTLACRTGNCSRAGLVPGQYTAASTGHAGVPANTLITDGPVLDTGAGKYTITLASPLTQNVPDATTLTFMASRGGLGYGVWYSNGSFFANRGGKFLNNTFEHTFAAPLFLINAGYALLQGNTYTLDGREFVDPTISPSPCINAARTVNMRVVGENCQGASGTGLEAQHPVGLTITGGKWVENGANGVSICGGHDNVIGGAGVYNNNGQYRNRPYVSDYHTLGLGALGIKISGSCTTSQIGTTTNLIVDDVIAGDTQMTPTQNAGVGYYDVNSNFINLKIGTVTGSGNIDGLIDPRLKLTAPVFLTSSSTFDVPFATTSLAVTACGGGGAGGGVAAAVATGSSGLPGVCVEYDLEVTPGAAMAYTIGAGGTPGAAGANNGGDGAGTVFGGVTASGGAGGLGSATGDASALGFATVNSLLSTSSFIADGNTVIRSRSMAPLGLAGTGSTGGAGIGCMWGPLAAPSANSAGTAATGFCGSGSGAGSSGGSAFAGGAGAPGAIFIRPQAE